MTFYDIYKKGNKERAFHIVDIGIDEHQGQVRVFTPLPFSFFREKKIYEDRRAGAKRRNEYETQTMELHCNMRDSRTIHDQT